MPPTRKSSRTIVKRKTLLNRRSLRVDVVAKDGQHTTKLHREAAVDDGLSMGKALKYIAHQISEQLPVEQLEQHSTD